MVSLINCLIPKLFELNELLSQSLWKRFEGVNFPEKGIGSVLIAREINGFGDAIAFDLEQQSPKLVDIFSILQSTPTAIIW